jgi:hypothetical protein
MIEMRRWQWYRQFLNQVSPASLLDVSAGNCQRALVVESGCLEIGRGHRRDQK